MSEIFHITSGAAWDEAQVSGGYRSDSLDTEGFIHCATAAQLAWVAGKFYRGRTGLVLLTIEPERLSAPLRWESPPGKTETFPHIYGSLNVDAVTKVEPFDASELGPAR